MYALMLERFSQSAGHNNKYIAMAYIFGLMGAPKSKTWVARIKGTSEKYGYDREFLKHNTDHTLANGSMTRGTHLLYILSDGCYEVSSQTSWRNVDRYFCIVEHGVLSKACKEDVGLWLRNHRSE